MTWLTLRLWHRRILHAGVLLGFLGCPLAVAAQQNVSLADLARREQERRKGIKVPAKVYTNKDVKSAPRPPAELPPPTPTPVPDAPGAKPDEKAEQMKDPVWWKGRMDQAREELRRNEMFAEALQSRVGALASAFMAADPYQRARIGEDRQKVQAEFERVKADIERFKKLVADIEEEARQAGVPPGWLR